MEYSDIMTLMIKTILIYWYASDMDCSDIETYK